MRRPDPQGTESPPGVTSKLGDSSTRSYLEERLYAPFQNPFFIYAWLVGLQAGVCDSTLVGFTGRHGTLHFWLVGKGVRCKSARGVVTRARSAPVFQLPPFPRLRATLASTPLLSNLKVVVLCRPPPRDRGRPNQSPAGGVCWVEGGETVSFGTVPFLFLQSCRTHCLHCCNSTARLPSLSFPQSVVPETLHDPGGCGREPPSRTQIQGPVAHWAPLHSSEYLVCAEGRHTSACRE